MGLNINSQWYCSAVIQYWFGRALGASAAIARDWFYDPARWGPMAGYQPSLNEIVGIFVCEGNCRGITQANASPARERSNVVLVPWYGISTYTSAASRFFPTFRRR